MVRAVAFLLVLAAAGVFAEEPEKLVKGTKARPGEFPYMVSIRRNGNHHCGGSIVTSTLILTAAHCVKPLMDGKSDVTIVSGSNSLKNGGNIHKPAIYLIHEKWSAWNPWDYDVGAIKLRAPIKFNAMQRPIKIAGFAAKPGSKVTISAWGAKGWPPVELATELEKLEVPVISQDKCQEAHKDLATITENHMCTYKAPGVGTCSGDSGSPAVQDEVQVGLVSGGIPCARGQPDIFTNLQFVRDFVNRALAV